MVYHNKQWYQIRNLLRKINQQHRKPTLYEYDILIDYFYPIEERWKYCPPKIASDLDIEPPRKVLDHVVIKMFKNEDEQKKWEKTHPFNQVKKKVYRYVD